MFTFVLLFYLYSWAVKYGRPLLTVEWKITDRAKHVNYNLSKSIEPFRLDKHLVEQMNATT